MGDTLATMKAMVTRWHKEDEDDSLLADAINDGIESLWRSILLVNLSQFMSAPVTSLDIAAGSERQTIISIPDPTVAPTVAGYVDTEFPAVPAHTVNCQYTYVTESGSETNPSPVTTYAVPINLLAYVPPPPQVPGALGWNLYASVADVGVAFLALQNSQPIPFNVTWQELGGTGVVNQPASPPPPTVNNTADNIFYIRLVQIQNPDTTWTTWQAGDLDGLLMKRAASSIAAATTYQGYAYDILNGNVMELRPAAGQALNPRYFYVVKPRRLRFDNAPLPFTGVSSVEFIKNYAISSLNLSNKEFAAAQGWSAKADRVRLEVLEGLNTQATRKQQTITPYFGW